MDYTTLVIFALVYVGMVLGEIPGLALDRTGVALLGAIALLAAERVTPQEAWSAIDVPTITLTFALLVVSSQLRLGGFYAAITQRVASAPVSPDRLLAILVGVSGLLSAVLANDIVCLAVAPVLVQGCARRGLDPVPFLLALAASANVGSAATLIGNPQNLLIGQTLRLSFAGYMLDAAVPALLGLVAVWWIIRRQFAGRWAREIIVSAAESSPVDVWQMTKGLLVVAALMVCFLIAPWPREVVGLAGAGLLLLSRRMASRDILGLVDWHLIALFMGLFVVNHALVASGWLAAGTDALKSAGIDLTRPAWLFGVTTVLSNVVSNVPAVMLLLPSATHELAGPTLALSSTLAGNLFIVGSIANIIVVDQAARSGVRISWRMHARVGVPITLWTLALAAGWLWLRAR